MRKGVAEKLWGKVEMTCGQLVNLPSISKGVEREELTLPETLPETTESRNEAA